MTSVSFKIKQDSKKKLASFAQESDQSVSQYMRSLVRHALETEIVFQPALFVTKSGEEALKKS